MEYQFTTFEQIAEALRDYVPVKFLFDTINVIAISIPDGEVWLEFEELERLIPLTSVSPSNFYTIID